MSIFGDVVHTVSRAAKGVAHQAEKAAKTAGKGAVAVLGSPVTHLAQTALKSTPLGATPLGMIGGAALSGLQAAAQGRSIEDIAWAAAEGGAPAGLDRALEAARALRNGEPVLNVALREARAQLAQNTDAGKGFALAETLLRSGASPAAIKAARDRLPAAAKGGFNAALGVLSKASQRVGVSRRPLSTARPLMLSMPRRATMSAASTTALVARALQKNPHLVAAGASEASRRLKIPVQRVNDAFRLIAPKRLQWRALTPRAANFIRTHVPHANVASLTGHKSDTAGLVGTGPQYKITAGELPYQVAQKYSPDHNYKRWHEIVPANPGVLKEVNLGGGNYTISPWTPGTIINLPASWFPGLSVPGIPSLPSVPTPASAPIPIPASGQTELDAATVLQAKATLGAWAKTDGMQSSPLPDYGMNLTDMTAAWTQRDGVMLVAFSRWWNGSGRTPQLTEGSAPPGQAVVVQALDQAHASALHTWAEGKGATVPSATPTATPASTQPAPAPSSSGSPFPNFPLPPIPGLTAPASTEPGGAPPVPGFPGLPPAMSQPGLPPAVTAQQQPAEGDSGAGVAIVGLLAAAALLA